MICDYGCGKEAKYPFDNGKWCCKSHYSKCPKVREEQSKRMKEIQNRSEVKANKSKTSREIWNRLGEKAKMSKAHKFTIEKIQEIYPFFSQIEEMRYNPDKSGEKEIQVHCKYSECKNSKEKGGWFTPSRNQFYSRQNALEHVDGNDGCFFYCLDECKQECCLYYFRSDPNILSKFKKYDKEVGRETNLSVKNFFNEIENIELRGIKYGYELDHKYSIYDGFINNINPKIIGHWKNLECIPELENRKKNRNSSIMLEKLLKDIRGK